MELILNDVYKSYNNKNYALNGFSYFFSNGIYGLLGENGAGKSTLMNLITQNINPTKGSILYNGEKIETMGAKYRELIGYMPQQQELYDEFTGERFLWYMSALKGLNRKQAISAIDTVLDSVNLSDERHKKIKYYSGGMKQRILIAQALLSNPKILILDEPTAGLDPKERIRIRNYISNIAENRIIIIATHIVSDIENIANEVLIMKNGILIRNGIPSDILKEINHKVFEVIVNEEQMKKCNDMNIKRVNMLRTYDGIKMRIICENYPSFGNCREVSPCLEDLYFYTTE